MQLAGLKLSPGTLGLPVFRPGFFLLDGRDLSSTSLLFFTLGLGTQRRLAGSHNGALEQSLSPENTSA